MYSIRALLFFTILVAITPFHRGKTIVPREVDSDEQESSSVEIHEDNPRSGKMQELRQPVHRLMDEDYAMGQLSRFDDNIEPDEAVMSNEHHNDEDLDATNGDEDAFLEEDMNAKDEIDENQRHDVDEENEPHYHNEGKRNDDEGFRRDMNEETDEDEDDNAIEDIPPMNNGFAFKNPFAELGLLTKYFEQLERVMSEIIKRRLFETTVLGDGSFANTTEEDVNIDGNKYHIIKSVIKSDDNNDTLYVETLSPSSNSTGSEVSKDEQEK